VGLTLRDREKLFVAVYFSCDKLNFVAGKKKRRLMTGTGAYPPIHNKEAKCCHNRIRTTKRFK
jgi:hypothetical protein